MIMHNFNHERFYITVCCTRLSRVRDLGAMYFLRHEAIKHGQCFDAFSERINICYSIGVPRREHQIRHASLNVW